MSSDAGSPRRNAHPLPPDVQDIAAQLDGLAAADRASAPRDLESRVAGALFQTNAAGPSAPAPASLPFPVQSSAANMSWRLAASIALCAAAIGGMTWFASRGPSISPTLIASGASESLESLALSQELDDFLSNTESWDLGVSESIASAREAIEAVPEFEEYWSDDPSDALLLEDTL